MHTHICISTINKIFQLVAQIQHKTMVLTCIYKGIFNEIRTNKMVVALSLNNDSQLDS